MTSYIAIFGFPLVVFWLFARFTPATALSWTLLGSYLFLPERFGINLPLLPVINKEFVPAATAAIAGAILVTRKDPSIVILKGAIPRNWVVLVLLVTIVAGSFATALTNTDALQYGVTRINGLRLYDAFSMTLNSFVALIPFLLARKYLADVASQRSMLIAFCIAGFIYTFFALFEVRFSPQLSRWVYDYFPHSFRQHMRDGGYRPVVFLHHALWLAIFLAMATLSCLAAYRAKLAPPAQLLLAAMWLLLTLILSKSLGALAICLFLGVILLFLPSRSQILVAGVVAGIVLLYPMLRGAGMIRPKPLSKQPRWSAQTGPVRLNIVCATKNILLAKANQRPIFGWGGWGRPRVYDSMGRDISVTDGRWIITMGSNGWAGYVGEFGLMTIPLMLLALRWRRYELTAVTAGVSVVMAANLIDLIPNGTLTPLTWMLAGALAGRLELGQAAAKDTGDATEDADVSTNVQNAYTRQNRRHRRNQETAKT